MNGPTSKTHAKKLLNLSKVLSNQVASQVSNEREEMLKAQVELRDRYLALERQYANALALLEAFTRRHGTSSFDRQTVQSLCARGQVEYTIDPERITVALRTIHVALDPDDKVT